MQKCSMCFQVLQQLAGMLRDNKILPMNGELVCPGNALLLDAIHAEAVLGSGVQRGKSSRDGGTSAPWLQWHPMHKLATGLWVHRIFEACRMSATKSSQPSCWHWCTGRQLQALGAWQRWRGRWKGCPGCTLPASHLAIYLFMLRSAASLLSVVSWRSGLHSSRDDSLHLPLFP